MVENSGVPPLIGAAEAARILGVDPATVVRWVHSGRAKPAVKGPGQTGAWLFTRKEVARLKRQLDRNTARQGAA